MIVLPAIVYYLSAHGALAQLANSDQSDKSCRDLGYCRSIWDVVWSCLITIFACTWLAVHLNVPKQGKGRLWKVGRRLVAFGAALIAPEWIIAEAWDQRASAKKIASDHKHNEWTLTHGFFVDMGGFVVQHGDRKYVLEPDEIDTYLRNGQINMTEEDIQDKSKGDMLTKGFVVLQTTWFILQIIARAIAHLPITELEFSTLAFAVLNSVTYAVWWNKPLDVQCPILLAQHTRGRPIGRPERHRRGHGRRRVSSVPFLNAGVNDKGTTTSTYIIAGIGLIFGGIHCIAWVSHFPTTLEKLLWQISSVATVAVPVVVAAYNFIDKQVGFSEASDNIFYLPVVILYFFARLFLLVLAFTTLRSLPLDAYTTVHWTTFIPHI